MKYGFCLNHPNKIARNAKRLCDTCTKERHERSAESKGFTIKKKEDGFSKIHNELSRQELYKEAKSKKTKIKPISKDKASEINLLSEIKKQKIHKVGKQCEICDKPGEVDLFHIIGVGDKKHSTNPTNLLLSCRFCHLVWGANDWSKIVKFKNFEEIMSRLKSLDEGKYWKLKHKIDKYYEQSN
jgi:hypothetical protein